MSWKCSKCETKNDGEYCAVCGESKENAATQQQSSKNENNRISDELIEEQVAETEPEEETSNNENKRAKKEKVKIGGWTQELYEWTSSIAWAVVIALIINQFFFALVQVDGQSMEPTLQHGDRLIVRKAFYTPEQKDVVIVKSEALNKFIVKRIVALPGQTVTFDSALNLKVDDAVMNEPYILAKQDRIFALYDYPITVPKKGEKAQLVMLEKEYAVQQNHGGGKMKLELLSDTTARVSGSSLVEDGLFDEATSTYKQDCYFVMGDNRNNSSDSRNLGVIPKSELLGKAEMRMLPLSKIGFIK